VLGGNYPSTEQVNSIQQLLAYSLITRTEFDIGEIIYIDLVTKLLNKSRLKYVSYPRFISCALQVLLGFEYTQDKKFGVLPLILSNSNFTKDPSKVTDIELTAHMIAVNNQRDSVSPPPLARKPKKGKSQTVTLTLPKSQGPEASGALSKKKKRPKSKKPPTKTKTFTDIQAYLLSDDELDEESDEEEVLAAEDDMDEDIQALLTHPFLTLSLSRVLFNKIAKKQWEHHKEAALSYADIMASIDQYYDENIAHRDQTDKLVEASMSSLDRSSTTISDLYKGMDVITKLLKDINNVVKDDPAANQKINEATDTFARISSNITKEDTHSIRSMMAEMYAAFKGTLRIDKGKGITIESDEDPLKRLVPASTIIYPGPNEPVRVEFLINGKIVYLTKQEILEYWGKEGKMKKAVEEAKLLAISMLEVIKVVREEAKKLEINPKEAISTKAGETFKKAQDAEHEVLKREHS
ncbi:hypothetical protein Tco_0806625, partial [Tanacetum coccineum]